MPAFAGMTAIIADIYSFIVIPAQAGIQKDNRSGLFTESSNLTFTEYLN